jgi:hypothetical protein
MMSIVTGIPSSGKSEFVDAMMVNLARGDQPPAAGSRTQGARTRVQPDKGVAGRGWKLDEGDKMSFFERFIRDKTDRFMSNVSDHVKVTILRLKEQGGQLTWGEYKALHPLNSYERKLLHPYLDDEALIRLTEICLGNSSYQRLGDLSLARHYDEAIVGELTPMLIERIRRRG